MPLLRQWASLGSELGTTALYSLPTELSTGTPKRLSSTMLGAGFVLLQRKVHSRRLLQRNRSVQFVFHQLVGIFIEVVAVRREGIASVFDDTFYFRRIPDDVFGSHCD